MCNCIVCGKDFDKKLSTGADVCKDCRYAYKRAKNIEYTSGLPVDVSYIKRLLSQDRCAYCGRFITEKEIEHKIPLSRGGTNDNSNLCISCVACNNDKGGMTDSEYAEWKKLDTRLPEINTRQTVLKLLSKYELTQTIYKTSYRTEREDYDPPVAKNIAVIGENCHIIGYKKTMVRTRIFSIKKTISKEKLTKYGEIYNTICRLANKKVIKCKTETTIEKELITQF